MDVLFFLKRRTAFLRQFYEMSIAPFAERKRKIEAEEEPWIPPYSEDPEPAFLCEWFEAEESIQIVGYSCICMLAASLHLYLSEWERQLGWKCGQENSAEFNKGWLNRYRACFAQRHAILWEESGADIDLLEQIVLARNRVQHPGSISEMHVTHSGKDVRKHSHVFFVDQAEMRSFGSLGGAENDWLMPSVTITREQFLTAIQEVERFAAWLDAKICGVDTSRDHA